MGTFPCHFPCRTSVALVIWIVGIFDFPDLEIWRALSGHHDHPPDPLTWSVTAYHCPKTWNGTVPSTSHVTSNGISSDHLGQETWSEIALYHDYVNESAFHHDHVTYDSGHVTLNGTYDHVHVTWSATYDHQNDACLLNVTWNETAYRNVGFYHGNVNESVGDHVILNGSAVSCPYHHIGHLNKKTTLLNPKSPHNTD